MNQLVGYDCVSSSSQNLEAQIDHLKKEGCERIFTDKISGREKEKAEAGQAAAKARGKSGERPKIDPDKLE